MRCDTRTAQRDAPISSPIGCKVARHMRIPLYKRASVAAMERERWGDSRGHEPHESSTEETRPTIDVRGCKYARKSISSDSAPSIVWFAIRRRQGLRETNTEQDRAARERGGVKRRRVQHALFPHYGKAKGLRIPRFVPQRVPQQGSSAHMIKQSPLVRPLDFIVKLANVAPWNSLLPTNGWRLKSFHIFGCVKE